MECGLTLKIRDSYSFPLMDLGYLYSIPFGVTAMMPPLLCVSSIRRIKPSTTFDILKTETNNMVEIVQSIR